MPSATQLLLGSGDDPRERAFRKALWVSAAAHVVLLAFAAFGPMPRPSATSLPAVVEVSLVAAPPGTPPPAARPEPRPKPKAAPPAPAPAPKPEPKPEPVAVPPPPVPKPEKVLLPKEAVKAPEPKPKAEPKPEPKTEPAPRAEPAPPKQENLQDMLARLRTEAGEDAPEAVEMARRPAPDVAPGPPGGGGPGVRVSAEEAAWRRRVKVHVTRAWVLAPGLRRQVISTEVRVKLSATGDVLEVDVTRRSGNPWFDDSVVRAVEKATPLPAPPEADAWRFVFSPQDLL